MDAVLPGQEGRRRQASKGKRQSTCCWVGAYDDEGEGRRDERVEGDDKGRERSVDGARRESGER